MRPPFARGPLGDRSLPEEPRNGPDFSCLRPDFPEPPASPHVRPAFRQRNPPDLRLPNAARRRDPRRCRRGENRHGRPQRLRQNLVAENSHRTHARGFRRRSPCGARCASAICRRSSNSIRTLSVQREHRRRRRRSRRMPCAATKPATAAEAELAELLHLIDHADGWNLDARIKATATALDAPPLDAPVGAAVRRRETPGGAVPRARLPAGFAAASTSRPTISTPNRSAGWRIICAGFPAR